MRKTAVYRARPGIRLPYGRRGNEPAAGFVGGPSITRTKPTKTKVSLLTRTTDTISVSSSVMLSVIGPDGRYPDPTDPTVTTSSLYLEAAISTGRYYERKKYNAQLLGLPAYSVDTAPWPSLVIVDTVSTGTLVSPSWTHASVGFNQAFVGLSLSSSYKYYEKTLNLYASGSQLLETTAAPAYAPQYYTKQQRYQTVTVKHTASFFDTVVPYSGVIVPTTFLPGTGTLCNIVTGSNINSQTGSFRYPATFRIPVTNSGKLEDIKIWIELIHLSGGPNLTYPLGNLVIALRSPNVSWGGHAHPIRNDPALLKIYTSNAVIYTGDPNAAADFYYQPAGVYRDTFLLWESFLFGPYDHDAPPLAGGWFDSEKYPAWERDRGMRTVFSDGGAVPNPRHLLGVSPSGNYNGAPNVGALGILPMSAHGFDVPWTSDKTVFPATESYQAPGSPPAGWLSGPGNTAAINEWPTTGVNYGTNSIRPLYPLLDSIYQVKPSLGTEWGSLINQPLTGTDAIVDFKSWKGFRPGLKGTEISGTWEIMVSTVVGNVPTLTYLRQVRLEFTFETPQSTRSALDRSRNIYAPRRAKATLLSRISGSDVSGYPGVSASFDYFINETRVDIQSQNEIGHSFGLSQKSGSTGLDTSQALLYGLSGTLANISGTAPAWLFNNSFGMPQIPLSSSSLSPRLTHTVARPIPFTSIMSPNPLLPSPAALSSVAAQYNPAQKLTQLAIDFVSGSTS